MLEASAGTGKTYTIAALAARYVAEGTPLEQLLLVTFTRMATGELRERVRERLVSVEAGLAAALAGVRRARTATRWSRCSPTRGRARSRPGARGSRARSRTSTRPRSPPRTASARRCSPGSGCSGDMEAGAAVVEDISDLLAEVVDDLYVRRFHRHGQPQFPRAEALSIARIAIENPAARIEPRAAGPDTIAAMRVRLAERAREELERRKRRLGILTYDDLLTRLEGALTGSSGPANARRLRSRYRVVLVDEFQDTDPVQWAIMREAFGDGDTTLVLIGDPKQAIYAFRGADVYAYLDAARDGRRGRDARRQLAQRPARCSTPTTRSSRAPSSAIPGSRTAPSAPRRPTASARLAGAPEGAPLRVRVLPRDDPAVPLTPAGYASAPAARELIARDVAADIARLLASERDARDPPRGRGERAHRAGDAGRRRRARPLAPHGRAGPRGAAEARACPR